MSDIDSERAASDGRLNQRSARVLLVDDNTLGREMVRGMLTFFNLEAVEASNGREAVEFVEREPFDLVLMDIQMPIMDGIDATRAIRQLDISNAKALPIIAMTAHAFDEHREQGFNAGFSDYVIKPIDMDVFGRMLQRWLPDVACTVPQHVDHLDSDCLNQLKGAVPGIDIAAGIRRVAGDRDAYLMLLKKFPVQFATFETDLLCALENGQLPDALMLVHSLKGVAGNLGAIPIYDQAARLETQIRNQGQPDELKAMLSQLNQFLAAIEKLPERDQQETAGGTMGSADELMLLLKELIPFLRGLQIQESKALLKRIEACEWPLEFYPALDEIATLIGSYRLTDAALKVEKLIVKEKGDGETQE